MDGMKGMARRSGLTYTEAERDIIMNLSIRQTQVLLKLARLAGLDGAERQKRRIPLDAFIGKGFDDYDARQALKLVARIKTIVKDVYLRCGSLFVEFRQDALPVLNKMVLKAAKFPPCGNGAVLCDAILALKMAMRTRSDVWYRNRHDHENFNYGEDVSYMDKAFSDDRWLVNFGDKAGELSRREIHIRPIDNEKIQISQIVSAEWPGFDDDLCERLAVLPISDVTNPEKWEQIVPELAEMAALHLEKAKMSIARELETRLEDGTISNRPEIARRMESAVQEKDALCKLLSHDPEVRSSPEWPLGQEPKAFFREYSCSLPFFIERYQDIFNDTAIWQMKEFAAQLWLELFAEKFGILPDNTNIEDYGYASVMEDLREDYPEKASEIDPDSRLELGRARIRLAWGLSTKDFKSVSGFVNGVLRHPLIGKEELKYIGWSLDSKSMEPEALRKCLESAVKNALQR